MQKGVGRMPFGSLRAVFSILLTAFCVLPSLAFAAPRTFSDLVYFIISFINPIASILASIALLIFFYGIVLYIFKSADGEAHEKGRQLIFWGIVALFVLFSVWSLAGILVNTFFGAGAAGAGGVGQQYPGSTVYTLEPGRPGLNAALGY
jgi:hypothetical protein